MKGLTGVGEQESHLTTIQSQPGIDGNLGGEYVQAGKSSDTVPELPASCLLFGSACTHTHTNRTHMPTHTLKHTHHRIYLEIRCLGLIHCEPHKNGEL